jgi:DNA-binding NarL/FixJ family response regulator
MNDIVGDKHMDKSRISRAATDLRHPPTGKQRVKVMLVDDDPFFKQLVNIFLKSYFGNELDVVGAANCDEDGLAQAQVLAPQVILIDLDMPGSCGLGTIPLVHVLFPATRIVGISLQEDEPLRRMFLAAGGDTLVPKASMRKELVPAIRRAVAQSGLSFKFAAEQVA